MDDKKQELLRWQKKKSSSEEIGYTKLKVKVKKCHEGTALAGYLKELGIVEDRRSRKRDFPENSSSDEEESAFKTQRINYQSSTRNCECSTIPIYLLQSSIIMNTAEPIHSC